MATGQHKTILAQITGVNTNLKVGTRQAVIRNTTARYRERIELRHKVILYNTILTQYDND